jgi:hypothetical protein
MPAIGYLLVEGEPNREALPWPRPEIEKLQTDEAVLPLVTVNSKIRVSQGGGFDWLGRETLMTKGNPHCYSVQVCLRKEMDLTVVEAAQAADKWFLLGSGTESRVELNLRELHRLEENLREHLARRMTKQ